MASFSRKQILQEAFNVVIQKKYLWFIGFFAGLVAYGGEADFFFRNSNTIDTLKNYLIAIREAIVAGEADTFLKLLRAFVVDNPSTALTYLGLVVLLFAIFAWIIIISQATIVRIVGRTVQKKPTGILDGLATGSGKFWPIFIMNVIAKLFSFGLLVLLAIIPAVVFFINGKFAWALTTSLGWFVVTIPISIIISFLMKFALAYITLRDESAVQSFRDGWTLFSKNWLVSLEMALLVYVINLGVSIVVAGVLLLMVNPFSPAGLVTILVALAIVLGFVSAYSYSVWTIAFLKFQEGKANSKIGEWTTNLVNFAGPKKITR